MRVFPSHTPAVAIVGALARDKSTTAVVGNASGCDAEFDTVVVIAVFAGIAKMARSTRHDSTIASRGGEVAPLLFAKEERFAGGEAGRQAGKSGGGLV